MGRLKPKNSALQFLVGDCYGIVIPERLLSIPAIHHRLCLTLSSSRLNLCLGNKRLALKLMVGSINNNSIPRGFLVELCS